MSFARKFTTYTRELQGHPDVPFHPAPSAVQALTGELSQPGALLVALDLHLFGGRPEGLDKMFDPVSLAVAETEAADAVFATDFQTDAAGYVRTS